MVEIADERVRLEKVDLQNRLGVLQQSSQLAQSPQSMMHRALARVFEAVGLGTTLDFPT